MKRLARLALMLSAAALPLATLGCFNPFAPRIAPFRTVSQPPPRPDSPRNALLLFEWCWEQRRIDEYEELFTEDFRFDFATTDTSGNAYLERGFTREDELASARHLFLGGDAGQPAASRITLDFDPDLVAFPDSRPGKAYPWHVEIFTRANITIDLGDASQNIRGSARFYLVRGDSAKIPEELANRFGPDPNRWWIERYEEEVPTGANLVAGDPAAGSGQSFRLEAHARGRAVPLAVEQETWNVSWGWVKVRYR